jgi:WD40 repeat protein
VTLWEWATRQALWTAVGHSSRASVAFSPDGTLIASAGMGDQVKVLDVATGRPLGTLSNTAQNNYWAIVFAPSGSILAAAGDFAVGLWAVTGTA